MFLNLRVDVLVLIWRNLLQLLHEAECRRWRLTMPYICGRQRRWTVKRWRTEWQCRWIWLDGYAKGA